MRPIQPHTSVALRERGRVAALFQTVLHRARRQPDWRASDRRTLRTWRQCVLGVVVARSTRLVTVGQAVLGQRLAQSTKAVAMALGYLLSKSRFPASTVSPLVLEATARHLDPAQLATSRGKVVLALDPTDYPKRSRGAPVATTVATTSGYVDVWAGLVLTGKPFLPLARALFSSRHPTLMSQNKGEEAVLDAAVALLERLNWAAILVADRAFGRKELLVALLTRWDRPRDFVIRVDADVAVFTAAAPAGAKGPLLHDVLATQPVVGEVVWDRGQEGTLRCEARTVTATLRFSRTGRQDDHTDATLQFIEVLPLAGVTDPLVLATTLPVDTLADIKGVVRVYSWRWAIETAFETLKAWGLGRFMVRSWQAIDRLLWLVAVAYALLVVAMRDGSLTVLREQAARLLKRLSVLGRCLTVGKLAEAIGLDHVRHRRAWASAWLS